MDLIYHLTKPYR